MGGVVVPNPGDTAPSSGLSVADSSTVDMTLSGSTLSADVKDASLGTAKLAFNLNTTIDNRVIGTSTALTGGSPAVLTPDVSTTVTFATQVRTVVVDNDSFNDIYVNFDAVATTSSYRIDPGSAVEYVVTCTAVQILSSVASPINTGTDRITVTGFA